MGQNTIYTGEISGEQLKDFDVKWVIIGHSERRIVFNETNQVINAKVLKAQQLKLNTIICVGENAEQRELDQTNDVIKSQLDAIKDAVNDWNLVVIAYEPVWAIGTGLTATPEQAQETHANIRAWLKENVSDDVANAVAARMVKEPTLHLPRLG